MTIGDETAYSNFDYSKNAQQLLSVRDGDIDILLKIYNIKPNALDEMIKNIQEWYDKQPHLPRGQLHDRMIIGHLITRGFSVEQAKEKIDNYFSAKHRVADLIGGRCPVSPNVCKYMKEGYWFISPIKTVENHRILLLRIINPDMVVLDVAKLGFLMGDYRLFNETTQGDHWIIDCSNATINHVLQFSPLLISKIYYHITSCYALKIKGLHFVNVPSFGQSLLTLFKKIMKPKHKERLHLYDSFEKIFNVLPKEVFPKDLGGTANITVQEISDKWCDTLLSDNWRDFYAHQDKYFISDESKRITSPKISDSYGVEGSFRKLELD